MSLATTQALDTLRMDIEREQTRLRIARETLERESALVEREQRELIEQQDRILIEAHELELLRKKLKEKEEEHKRINRMMGETKARLGKRRLDLEHHRRVAIQLEEQLLQHKRKLEELDEKIKSGFEKDARRQQGTQVSHG